MVMIKEHPMDLIKIADMKKGLSVTGFYLVKTAVIKNSASGNSRYGDYTLADETGEINGKVWEVAEPESCPRAGSIIKVQGMVNEYQGKLQFRIDKFRESTPEDPIDPASLVPAAPVSGDELYLAVDAYADKIGNEKLRELVKTAMEEHLDSLLVWPAAVKNHHSIRSGLLYHTLTMLRSAEGLINVYTFLQSDLVYAGAILHDIAKLYELDSTVTGIATDYTRDGLLLGHIVQGIIYVDRTAEKIGLDKRIATLIQHMLLAHHYEPEFGSPRRPMFPEAEILHYLDIIDARMYDMQKALGDTEGGKFSERLWTLHNRQLYSMTDEEREMFSGYMQGADNEKG
jgi:3'-5' exoribonuclease